MKAVIMAGGEGTRLRPLTCNLPKPMVPILNRPMMEHIVRLLKKHRITEIASTLWYLPEDVITYFEDGSRLGVSMEYYVEREPLGTAGSVKNAASFLDETFVVMSGDALTDIDLSAAIAFHKKRQAVATIVLTSVSNPLNYGVVIINSEGRIVQFLEKPSWSEVFSDTVNTGIYVLEPEVLDLFSLKQPVDFSRDVFPKLLQRGAPLYGFIAHGYWSDIGNLEIYRQAQRDSLDGKVSLQLPQPLKPGIYLEKGAKISGQAEIGGPLYVGEGAQVGPGAFLGPYSVLGPYVQVQAGAKIEQSTLWSGVRIGAYSQLRGCVCAKNVRLDDQVFVSEGVVLGEKVAVGAMSSLGTAKKVWPEKIIPSGTKLRHSLIWGNQERAPLFSKQGIAGDFRGGLTPEIIIQVGLSYAAYLGQGKGVLVTRDSSQLAQMAQEALTLGLLSGGVHVHQGGSVVGNLTRFAVQKLGLEGALHCQAQPEKSRVLIECWDGQGHFLSKAAQRRIENIYLREDFPRMNAPDLGRVDQAPDLRQGYLEKLAHYYANKAPHFPVGLVASDPESNLLSAMVEDFLDLAGYTVTKEGTEGLPTVVVSGNQWFIRDERGQKLSDSGWWRIFVRALHTRRKTDVAIPVHLSQTVSKEAEERGLNVHWTKSEPLFWMEAASQLGNTTGGTIKIFPYIEPIASIGEIFRFLSATGEKLSFWQDTTEQKTTRVLCPWEDKGRVMRELIQNSDPAYTVYLDGIKEYRRGGWTLVVPDGDEPVFKIYSEADTAEEAQSFMQHYVDLIKSYENKER